MNAKNLPPKSPLLPPEEKYFEKLPERTLARIKAQKMTPVRPMYVQKRVWMTLAAAVVVLLFVVRVGLFSSHFTQQALSEEVLTDLTDKELQQYLLYADVENAELAELLPAEEAILEEFSAELNDVESLEGLPVEVSIYDMY